MAETKEYPYETRLNILYHPLEVIEERALADNCTYKWYNQTLCQVNDSVVRLGVIQGEYHWRKHDESDEFFYVQEGKLLIDLEKPDNRTQPPPGAGRSQGDRPSNPGRAENSDFDGRESGDRSHWRVNVRRKI